jgi:hypothetical protein
MGNARKNDNKPTDELFQLLGFSTLPKKRIVTEESKRLFKEGTPYSHNIKDGQGFVIVAWEDFEKETKEPVLYIDLVPAFNKGSRLPRCNKHGKPYIIYDPEKKYAPEDWANMAVESPEPYGKNTGLVHQHTMEVLKKSGRMPEHIQKKNMFGLGLVKGDEYEKGEMFLQFMCNSANINPESVQYNEEFLLASYYCRPEREDIDSLDDDLQKMSNYNVKRALPKSIGIDGILSALFNQLPSIARKVCTHNPTQKLNSEWWWKENKNNPVEKNKNLMRTLFHSIKINDKPENKLAERVLHYININSKLDHKAAVINTQYADGNTALILAIKKGFTGVASQLLQSGASIHIKNQDGDTALMVAIKMNRKDLVGEILSQLKTEEDKLDAWASIARLANLDMVHLLITNNNLALLSKGLFTLLIKRATDEGHLDILNALNHYAKKQNMDLDEKKYDFTADILNCIEKEESEIEKIAPLFQKRENKFSKAEKPKVKKSMASQSILLKPSSKRTPLTRDARNKLGNEYMSPRYR